MSEVVLSPISRCCSKLCCGSGKLLSGNGFKHRRYGALTCIPDPGLRGLPVWIVPGGRTGLEPVAAAGPDRVLSGFQELLILLPGIS